MTDHKQRGAQQPEKNHSPIPDQSCREAIIRQLDTTMLVEASAGAGKTRSMVDRMIALLSQGKCSVDTLAAITFTRKAAAELRGRFQVALEKAAKEAKGEAAERLAVAASHAERVFIGTIHSFCARLLRERPVEAGIEPSFQELDEQADARLRCQAWEQYVAEAIVSGDPVLGQLDELGLNIGDLRQAFLDYATYPDVDQWPVEQVELPDLAAARDALGAYVAEIESLLPELPQDVGNDKLMPKLRRIARLHRQLNVERPAELIELLAEFGQPGKTKVIQKVWPGKKSQAVEQQSRWDQFCERWAVPLVTAWREVRYPVVLGALDAAARVYDRLRAESGVLNYQDLLLRAAGLLRENPQIRRYFRSRFTHLLVDEFQDTDPVQAEVMLLLTADDPQQTNWRDASPVPGSLFVVGDPKQSIFRFRRADIVTYNEVKKIVQVHGTVITLTANFRSLKPLITWTNATFEQIFPAEPDVYSPARSPMDPIKGDSHDGRCGAVEVLRIPESSCTKDAAVAYEAQVIARSIANELTDLGDGASAVPSDFMIVSARKRFLSLYANALIVQGIPCEVTGGAVLNEVQELALLCRCLEAVTQPDNPVALVAVLRGELFGFSDDVLYAHKRAGGRFHFRAPLPADLSSEERGLFEDAWGRLKQYEMWLKRLPVVAAIDRIAVDLGLHARAAAETGGNVRAGSVARALELVRSNQATLHSIDEIVDYLDRIVRGEERHDGLPAATPRQAPVRIMNLHQAKGLEAPFVFLADPTGKTDHEPKLHIDRSGNLVRGYLRISVKRGNQTELLAVPPQWSTFADEAKRFEDAEKDRLIYVAATRAGVRLVVAQREKGNKDNPWSPLRAHLTECAFMETPEIEPGGATLQDADVADDGPLAAAKAIGCRWREVRDSSYAIAAAKAVSVTSSGLGPSAGEHGTEWGSVIHLLLENAMRDPQADLQRIAAAGLTEHGLDVALALQATDTVRAVMRSDLWKRAQASRQLLVEVPFQKLVPADAADADSLPTILRGVIDLVFKQDQGWTVVDYKTDARPESELPKLVAHYRGQVETYASFWQDATGEPVTESGLYFTHIGRYISL